MFGGSIVEKLKKADLRGRGGAGFPAWQKWQMVKDARADFKYIIANGSEGEPKVLKDKFIIENYPEDLINGLKIAIEFLGKSEAYIYLNHDYFHSYSQHLHRYVGNLPIKQFRKEGLYIGGEETAMLNTIEGKFQEPRIKPPYPTTCGLWGKPTLINNIETFYCVSKIAKGEYKNTRFATISGDVPNPGVYEVELNMPIKQILSQTGNWLDEEFFIQCGGGASGAIYLKDELVNKLVEGAGAIVVLDKKKTDPVFLMQEWAQFFTNENCDKCTPCREGAHRLLEMILSNKIDYPELYKLLDNLEKASFCPLGKGMPLPFRGLLRKVMKK